MDTTESTESIAVQRPRWPFIVGTVVIGLVVVFLIAELFLIPQTVATERLVTPASQDTALNRSEIVELLSTSGVIASSSPHWVVTLALMFRGVNTLQPGAYALSPKSLTAWQLAGDVKQSPYMKWVTIPEGFRKEQIADLLAGTLGWTPEQKNEWITVDTAPDSDHVEGVYFPDTYLIPVTEKPIDVAARLRTHFEEVFAPFAKEATQQNIKWTTVIKIASLVQREAAGKADMPLVSGIIWNRLLTAMPLDIDATLQYIKGSAALGWWPKITVADKQIDSPYNTYKYAGLPPHPISNPGSDAIQAVLSPAKTDCVYYLHDASGMIHCAKTYAEHQQNIEKYL